MESMNEIHGVLRESTCAFEFLYELLFYENYFYLKKWLTDKWQLALTIQTWVFGRPFIENEKVRLSENNCQDLLLIIKFELSNENYNCVKLLSTMMRSPIHKRLFSQD